MDSNISVFSFMASGLHYMFRELFLIQNNFAAALLKYNLYTTKFSLLKYAVEWFLV